MTTTLKTLVLTATVLLGPAAFAQGPLPSASPAATVTDSGTFSYKDWKAARVEEARLTLDKTASDLSAERDLGREKASAKNPTLTQRNQNQLGLRPASTPARAQRISKPENRVQQAQLNYEVATELSVNDYFVLYLSQLKSDQAFTEAVKKMTPEEVTELMMAYKKHLEGGRSSVGMLPDGLLRLNPSVGANR